MIRHSLDIKTRFIGTNKYSSHTDYYNNVDLHDKIITYFNGSIWKMIPLNTMLAYPILHDYYLVPKYDSDIENKTDITVVLCPFTLLTTVFEGHLFPSDYTLNNSLLLIDASGKYISLLNGYIDNSNKINRHTANIKTVRNAFTDHPDCHYINVINMNKPPLLNKNYYTNNIPNKYNLNSSTLIRIVQYISSVNMAHKYTILIGHDANLSDVTGYDMVTSGFNKYIDDNKDKLEEKNGFIIPCLLSSALKLLKDPKIIYL